MAFTQQQRELALLAYPIFSNKEIADHIGCSIVWLEKLAGGHGVKKGDYCFNGEQSGYPFDISGYRFGRLRVLESKGRKDKNNTVWTCACECGRTKDYRAAVLRRGRAVECGHCSRRVPERRHKRGELGGSVWSKIKSHAADRGIAVTVDRDYVVELFQKQGGRCALSGLPIQFPEIRRSGTTGTASLDRINSSLPYESGNLQWLHKDVNQMKNKHEQGYFVELCRAVAANQDKTRKATCPSI